MTELKKGLIIEWDYKYVVVRVVYDKNKVSLDCLDSHANNIYSLDLEQLKDAKFIDPSEYCCEHEAMSIVGEVMAGQHDDRFDHWYES